MYKKASNNVPPTPSHFRSNIHTIPFSCRCGSRSNNFLLRYINLHCLISDLIRSSSLSFWHIQIVPRPLSVPCRGPPPTRSCYDLLLARIVTSPVCVTKARLALVVIAALHAETALRAALAETPITVLIRIAVLCIRAWVSAGISSRWKRTEGSGWDEKCVYSVGVALRINRIRRYWVATKGIVGFEAVVFAVIPGLDSGALFA